MMKTLKHPTLLAILSLCLPINVTASEQLNQNILYQPNMMAALGHLDMAKTYLEKATDNKGGHRNKAIDALMKTMQEVREGIMHADAKKRDEKTKSTTLY